LAVTTHFNSSTLPISRILLPIYRKWVVRTAQLEKLTISSSNRVSFVRRSGESPDFRDVTSHKELWEGNGNSPFDNSDTVMGMGREPGIFLRKAGKKRLRIASESEKVFARILDEFLGCSGLPKTSVFLMDNSKYYDLDPSPCILILRII